MEGSSRNFPASSSIAPPTTAHDTALSSTNPAVTIIHLPAYLGIRAEVAVCDRLFTLVFGAWRFLYLLVRLLSIR